MFIFPSELILVDAIGVVTISEVNPPFHCESHSFGHLLRYDDSENLGLYVDIAAIQTPI